MYSADTQAMQLANVTDHSGVWRVENQHLVNK